VCAHQEWLEARCLARAGPCDEVSHRRERLTILATRLKVRPRGRWTYVTLAQLILASTDDWTRPPCPLFVAEYKRAESNAEHRVRRLAEDIRKDLSRAGWKPDGNL
jgi:hypothetical protein